MLRDYAKIADVPQVEGGSGPCFPLSVLRPISIESQALRLNFTLSAQNHASG